MDSELVDHGAEPGYLKFFTKANLDQTPVDVPLMTLLNALRAKDISKISTTWGPPSISGLVTSWTKNKEIPL